MSGDSVIELLVLRLSRRSLSGTFIPDQRRVPYCGTPVGICTWKVRYGPAPFHRKQGMMLPNGPWQISERNSACDHNGHTVFLELLFTIGDHYLVSLCNIYLYMF